MKTNLPAEIINPKCIYKKCAKLGTKGIQYISHLVMTGYLCDQHFKVIFPAQPRISMGCDVKAAKKLSGGNDTYDTGK